MKERALQGRAVRVVRVASGKSYGRKWIRGPEATLGLKVVLESFPSMVSAKTVG